MKITYISLLTLLILFLTQLNSIGQEITVEERKEPLGSGTEVSLEKERRIKTFEIVWNTINENYFDAKFGGVDWEKIKAEFEVKVHKSNNDIELHALLQEMISRLNRSHLTIIPPEVFVQIEKAKAEVEKQSIEINEKLSTKTDEDNADNSQENESGLENDFEYKKYVLLDYLQKVHEHFEEHKLFPQLSDLMVHHDALLKIKQNTDHLLENFPKRVKGIDIERMLILSLIHI